MPRRRPFAAGALGVLIVASAAWLEWGGRAEAPAPPPEAAADEDSVPLPLPPLPPRIAAGSEYERCLGMLANDPEGAESEAESWATAGGGDAAGHCLGLARIALGDAAEGAELLDRLGDRPSLPASGRAAVLAQAAEAWVMAREGAKALSAYDRAVALAPDDPDLRVGRARVAADAGRHADAQEDLTVALSLDPQRIDALVQRATCLRHLERMRDARADIDRALTLDPDNPEALLERGVQRQRRDDPAGARADWERAMELAPDSPTADLAEQNLALLEAGPERK